MKEKTRKSVCNCINLRRAANAVTEYYDQWLKPSGLTINQYSLLINLSRLGRGSVSDLARQVGLDRTTLVRGLRPLLEAGLIEDLASESRRNRLLTPTESGRTVLKLARPLWEKAQAGLEDCLGREQVQPLTELLSRLEYISL